jgi:hypothetical protein
VTGTEVELGESENMLDKAVPGATADVIPLMRLLDVAVLLVGAALVELFCVARDPTMVKSVPGAEILLFWSIPLK